MSSSTITTAEVRPGVHLAAGPALHLEAIDALVLADVHWGYATSQRTAGRLVPLWGDDDIDTRVERLMQHFRPRSVVIVGDVVHDVAGAAAAVSTIRRLEEHARVVLVGGNHDRHSDLTTVATHRDGAFFFHHGDRVVAVPDDVLEIIGHHHPAAVWSDGAGTRIKMPALVAGPRRFILPAFSPWAGGVPWNVRLEPDEQLWLVSSRRIFPLATGLRVR